MAASNKPNTLQACMEANNERVAPPGVLQVGGAVLATLPTYTDTYLASLTLSESGELWVIDQSIGTPGATASAMVVQLGGIAETTVPTAVTDGQAVAVWMDEYGRIRIYGSDAATGSILVTDISPAKQAKLGPIAFTQLTAAGSTASTNVEPYENITFQVLVAAINTNVVVRMEGSLDDTNWFNMDAGGVDTVIVVDGTYQLSASGRAVRYVRFTFVSELGGTAATLDVDLMAGN